MRVSGAVRPAPLKTELKEEKIMKSNLRQFLYGLISCLFLCGLIFCLLLLVTSANAQTASFTYQEKPTDNATAANGTHQMQFGTFDALSDESPEVAAANNNFANAQIISGNTGSVNGNTIDATREIGEPQHAGVESSRSVWYSWTAPTAGSVTFVTDNTGNFNTTLAVYKGTSVNNLTAIVANDDELINGTQGQSRLTFGTQAGTIYRIAVAGHFSLSGNFTLVWQLSNLSVNDNFNFARDLLSRISESVTDTNIGGGKEPGEPNHYGNPGGKSIWFKWVGPNFGTRSYTFSTRGSTKTISPTQSSNTVMAVYTGASVNALTQIAGNDFFIDETSQVTFVATPGRTYYIAVDGYNSGAGAETVNVVLSWDISRATRAADFDGDKKSDITVFRPGIGTFFRLNSSDGNFVATQWGMSGDKPVPGDYDFDGKTDIAVFRPSNGAWYILRSGTGTFLAQQWGQNGDIPVPSHYRARGTIIGVFRPSNGVWYIQSVPAIQWGQNGDIPVAADYDGEGYPSIAVFRPSDGTWYIRSAANNNSLVARQWGQNGDIPVPADYDRDGRVDYAIFRPSTGAWFYTLSGFGGFQGQKWGQNGDIPVAGDYNGDNFADLAVFRPSDGTWYIFEPFNDEETARAVQFGTNGDVPATSAHQIP